VTISAGRDQFRLSPEVLVRAYAAGVFPMAKSRDDPTIYWIDPQERGVLPLDEFHIPRSLRKVIRQGRFDVRCDTACAEVISACAQSDRGREDTWINDEIERAYTRLNGMGLVHSVEAWQDGELAGGLYGMALGGAFFGESMFTRVTDASKVALTHLVAYLRLSGFVLLDTQFVTDHLIRFGAREIPARQYHRLLDAALQVKAEFHCDFSAEELSSELAALFRQSSTQTS